MAVSVIICTKHRPHVIVEYMDCIAQALTNAAAVDAEIIVVDASLDHKTCALVRQWASSCPFPVRLVSEPDASFAAALRFGACKRLRRIA
jgi:glycosyltransferase involved in cell wall biosynthesis